MDVSKTIRARVWLPTNLKLDSLTDLELKWKEALKLVQAEQLGYGELRQQFPDLPCYYPRAISWKLKKGNHPIYVCKGAFRLKETNNAIARYFVSISVPNRGRIWLPLRMGKEHEDLLHSDIEVCDSKLIHKRGRWYFHITIKKEIKIEAPRNPVTLSIDIGERVLATTVLQSLDTSISSPMFYGKRVRGIRRHYAYLRKRLGNKKLLRVIKRIRDAEKRKVDDILHKTSRAIVNKAKELGAVIVIGDLTGIRDRVKQKGKRLNRIVSNMNFYKLSQYIEYKAHWEGIPVVYAGEHGTSKYCHICNTEGKRPHRGLFICPNCGEYNADLNGAINIGKRFSEQCFENGAVGFQPEREGLTSMDESLLESQL